MNDTVLASNDVLQKIRQPVAEQLTALDEVICSYLSSDVALIRQVTQHIVQSGGKRVRPLLLLLIAGACGYSGREQVNLAAVIEFIHTATLLHDDVVDSSVLRRGVETAHNVFGGQASILVGDFLYSRAFELMAQSENIVAMRFLARTTNKMAEGEVLQLMSIDGQQPTEESYYQVIDSKTASLFAAASYVGAVLASQQDASGVNCFAGFGQGAGFNLQSFADCGREFGLAYQIIDDVLDYSGKEDLLGKKLGDDLAEGKITLPIIYTLANVSADSADTIRTIISEKRRDNLDVIMQAMHQVKALQYCRNLAAQHMQQAETVIDNLPDSAYKQALHDLFGFILRRDY